MRKLALAAMLLSTSAQADTLQIVLGSTISTYTGTVEQLNLDGQNGGVEFTVQRYSTSTTEDIFADGFEGGRGTLNCIRPMWRMRYTVALGSACCVQATA